MFTMASLFTRSVPINIIITFGGKGSRRLGECLKRGIGLIVRGHSRDMSERTTRKALTTFFDDGGIDNFGMGRRNGQSRSDFVVNALAATGNGFQVGYFFHEMRGGCLVGRVEVSGAGR